jgi:hypothetical protein
MKSFIFRNYRIGVQSVSGATSAAFILAFDFMHLDFTIFRSVTILDVALYHLFVIEFHTFTDFL